MAVCQQQETKSPLAPQKIHPEKPVDHGVSFSVNPRAIHTFHLWDSHVFTLLGLWDSHLFTQTDTLTQSDRSKKCVVDLLTPLPATGQTTASAQPAKPIWVKLCWKDKRTGTLTCTHAHTFVGFTRVQQTSDLGYSHLFTLFACGMQRVHKKKKLGFTLTETHGHSHTYTDVTCTAERYFRHKYPRQR